ncbi:uncharacterized protein LOC124971428 [Sciurus carolinensis]|uniref:uncharacterized protein LOC124971428 n=1 Tax=Sciurus carolinensis TaxID=30640 RepID=UPI001FB44EC5|nr:uncharacterized protein LOC124971428 [Sciurus carolinensis]
MKTMCEDGGIRVQPRGKGVAKAPARSEASGRSSQRLCSALGTRSRSKTVEGLGWPRGGRLGGGYCASREGYRVWTRVKVGAAETPGPPELALGEEFGVRKVNGRWAGDVAGDAAGRGSRASCGQGGAASSLRTQRARRLAGDSRRLSPGRGRPARLRAGRHLDRAARAALPPAVGPWSRRPGPGGRADVPRLAGGRVGHLFRSLRSPLPAAGHADPWLRTEARPPQVKARPAVTPPRIAGAGFDPGKGPLVLGLLPWATCHHSGRTPELGLQSPTATCRGSCGEGARPAAQSPPGWGFPRRSLRTAEDLKVTRAPLALDRFRKKGSLGK